MPAIEHGASPQHDVQLFEDIASDLRNTGYSIKPHALPPQLTKGLLQQVLMTSPAQFAPASVGRAKGQILDDTVRKDNIRWITGDSQACEQWLQWAGELQQCLNQQLFLGLFSFESHFAHYSAGDFYRRHLDAFKGEGNRILSVVAYLNSHWQEADGGELVLYPATGKRGGITVTPTPGTLALFLSEEFEHEVLPTRRDRFSIAGWFRLNSSSGLRADPPT
jgi:SM-20-related protein